VEDAFGRDDHESPSNPVEFFSAENVGEPLLGVLGMLAPVVLDDQPQVLVREVVASAPATIRSPNDQVDARLRKTGEHEQQAEPGLLRRVHTFPSQGCSSARHAASLAIPLFGGLDEPLGGGMACSDHAVGHYDEIDESDANRGKVQEGLLWRRDGQALAKRGLRGIFPIVRLHSLANQASEADGRVM